MKITDGDTDVLEQSLDHSTDEGKAYKGSHFKPVDLELLSAIRSGDHWAFQAFYLESFDAMFEFVVMLVHNEPDAEEICQQVFVRIWENRRMIDASSNFIGYVYKMVKTTTFKYFAHKKVIDNYINYQLTHTASYCNGTEEIVLDEETALIMEIALRNLPKQCRKVFEMSRQKGMSNEEIAETLGITTETVRSHLSHAVKKLKDLI